jgi:hypothetical protein
LTLNSNGLGLSGQRKKSLDMDQRKLVSCARYIWIQALGPTQLPIQWVPAALSPEVKRPGREADHSPPSSAEVKNAWRYISHSNTSAWRWFLVKHRGNFTFTFTFRFINCVLLNTVEQVSMYWHL